MKTAARLLHWHKKHGRDLPWRKTRDPYKILVSEIMLHQTQVDRVIVFYKEWLHLFSDWHHLANAKRSAVIKAWAGLGYNRRALALQEIAKHVDVHGVPKTQSDWQALKGIGPYTAAAICAFAHKKRVLPIDTNIRRVLGRVLLGIPFPDISIDSDIKKYEQTFLPAHGAFYDVPQALFDLANTYCLKKPSCFNCPLKKDCKASNVFLENQVEVPKRMNRKSKEKIHRNKKYPDRIYRGKILKCIRDSKGSVSRSTIRKAFDPTYKHKDDQRWLNSMLKRLEKDGLIERVGVKFSLPK